jgi:uncharacterized protein YdiU (UPF0061 family)
VAALFDLSAVDCNSDYFTQIFSGNQLVEGMQPYAMCYGGHQFGNWAEQASSTCLGYCPLMVSAGKSWIKRLSKCN